MNFWKWFPVVSGQKKNLPDLDLQIIIIDFIHMNFQQFVTRIAYQSKNVKNASSY